MKKSLLILLMFFPSVGFSSDDFQYWAWGSATLLSVKKIDLVTHGQLRFIDDASLPSLYLLSQKIQYAFHRSLGLGFNLTYINSRPSKEQSQRSTFTHQLRYEFEVNPQWTIGSKFKIINRNRLELRQIENKGSDNNRLRHRWHASFQPFFFNAEFFYDFKKDTYNENRIIPLGLSKKMGSRAKAQLFYMAQSSKKINRWSTNHILGTNLVIK